MFFFATIPNHGYIRQCNLSNEGHIKIIDSSNLQEKKSSARAIAGIKIIDSSNLQEKFICQGHCLFLIISFLSAFIL